nr:hypothetical protein [Tanacetum cinerariifolium]
MMKAQVHVSKSSTISGEQALPLRKHYCNLSSDKAYVEEEIVSKLSRSNLSNVVTNDMFQPWRALTTIINLCLTGKTSRFKRPRAPVLQTLWSVVNRAHLDYAERIWEEFTQSIHTFIEDKKNLAQHTNEKKKATLIVIPRSDHDSPAPKPIKAAKKFKPSAPKAALRPPVTKPALSQQPNLNPNLHRPSLEERSPISSLRSVDEFAAEAIPDKKPRVDDEEPDVHRALEESLKSIYDVPRGPLPPVVIKEPESRKYQPLPEVQGKGKEKVTDEQVESDEDVPGIDTGVQGEGQAGPNPDEQDEGQAGPNPDVSTQPQPEQMDEGFTAMAYPKVQENLKLTVEEHMILEEPASSTGTLSSLQHLTKDLSFGDLFFNDKPLKADNEKTTA